MTQDELNNKLFVSIVDNDVSTLIYLISQGADVNHIRNGYSMLDRALFQSKYKIIRILIENGADVTFKRTEKSFNILERLCRFLKCDANTAYDKNPFETGRFIPWFCLYATQKTIIDKYPETVFVFNKYEFLHNKLKKEYLHLFSAHELNLL